MHHGIPGGIRAGAAATLAILGAVVFGSSAVHAEVPVDTPGHATLPTNYGPHWAWVNDVSFFHMPGLIPISSTCLQQPSSNGGGTKTIQQTGMQGTKAR